MPVRFNCKTISIDDVIASLRALKSEHTRDTFSVYFIARHLLIEKMGRECHGLDDKEWRSAEGRVRRLLKKEEQKDNSCIKNTSWKENKASWTIITPEELQQEKEAQDAKDKEEREILEWLAARDVDVEDDNVYIARGEVRIPIQDFKILMEMSK
jgi:hypothetical protein